MIAAARKIFPRADSAETDLSAFLRGSLAVEAAGGADSRTEDPAGSSGVQRGRTGGSPGFTAPQYSLMSGGLAHN